MPDWSPVVDSAEELESHSEDYNDDNGLMTASVTLRCNWDDRHALVADICGNRRPWPKGSASAVPLASRASIRPFISPHDSNAQDGETIKYKHALVTIEYSTLIVDSYAESIEPNVESITLDHRWFRWGAGNGMLLREEEAPARQVRSVSYTRTDFNLLTIPTAYVNLIGYCNSDSVSFSLLGLTADVETLLYLPPQISTKVDSTNTRKFDCVRKFQYNPETWNSFYRALTGTYQKLYLAGSVTPYNIYPPTTFNGTLL